MRLPPEGPFDAGLTNGLVVIVSSEWPGREKRGPGDHLQPARALLDTIDANIRTPLPYVDVDLLKEGLTLTQAFRHARANDEFATITPRHIAALEPLDRHPGLRILDQARGRSVDDALWLAFAERDQDHLLFDLKDHLGVPEAEPCEECGRPICSRGRVGSEAPRHSRCA